jgi:hypothetical protein
MRLASLPSRRQLERRRNCGFTSCNSRMRRKKFSEPKMYLELLRPREMTQKLRPLKRAQRLED